MNEVFYWDEETKSALSFLFYEKGDCNFPSFFELNFDGGDVAPLLCFKYKDDCIKYYGGSYEQSLDLE